MIRKIIKIDSKLCNGCGLCVDACQEGAIGMIEGKAALLRDDYCDGLGNCLPACPAGAISFEEREAAAFDEAAVQKLAKKPAEKLACGCAGTSAKLIEKKACPNEKIIEPSISQLNQWPVQIKLVPVNAPYLSGAQLLIAADCTAYAYANFHNEFMKNKITLIGCPKLDQDDYSQKLADILKMNDIKSVTIVRMEVPCCGGLENAFKSALISSDKVIPWQVVVISTDGRILDR